MEIAAARKKVIAYLPRIYRSSGPKRAGLEAQRAASFHMAAHHGHGCAGGVKISSDEVASQQGSNYLADPPEERQRSLGNSSEVLRPGKVAKIGAEWSAEHLV
jgi:hypothetical protein